MIPQQYPEREYLLDECYEARARWERREWATTARAMGSVANGGTGIDDAIDALADYDKNVAEFERVFGEQGQDIMNDLDNISNGGL
jgi:hypothetical protein